MKTIVVGLGNPILSDDGIGVRIAEAVEAALPDGSSQELFVTEACVGGLRLMELLVSFDKAILIDAIKTGGEYQPGKVHRLTLEELRTISPTQHTASAHDTNLITALDLGKRIGLHLPGEIVIYAIEVENVEEFSEQMSPVVAGTVPQVVASVMEEIQ